MTQVDDQPEAERAIAGHDLIVDEQAPRPLMPILTAGQKREARLQRKHKRAVKTARALCRDELADFNPDLPDSGDDEAEDSDQEMEVARVRPTARPGAAGRFTDIVPTIEPRVNPNPVEEFTPRTNYPPGMCLLTFISNVQL